MKKRPVLLQHIRTNRIASAPSVAAFARRMRWGPNGIFHFDSVLKGKRLHHKGWGVPKVLNEMIHVKDVLGNQYRQTVGELARKLSSQAANKLRHEGRCGALIPLGTDTRYMVPFRPIHTCFVFRRSNGKLVRVSSLWKESQPKLGLSTTSAYKLIHGARLSINGVSFCGALTRRRKLSALTPFRNAPRTQP